MLVPKVDPELCVGCGACEDVCPDVFELQDDGLSHVIDASACSECDHHERADSCPAEPISFEEEETLHRSHSLSVALARRCAREYARIETDKYKRAEHEA
ncbi:MAG: ferredoxin [Halobacteriota archaeon]